jgi:hypothetical protein
MGVEGLGESWELVSPRVSKKKAERCVTHSYACDCREYRFQQMQQALLVIMIWAEQDCISGISREKAMEHISRKCHEALED